jgi:hypothetical protein
MNMGWSGNGDGWFTYDTVATAGFVFDVLGQTKNIAPTKVKFVGALDLGDGSPDDPYRDIEEAISEAPDNSTLIFKAGSSNAFSAAALTINRPLTLKGRDVTISKSGSRSPPNNIGVDKVNREAEDVLKERTRRFD